MVELRDDEVEKEEVLDLLDLADPFAISWGRNPALPDYSDFIVARVPALDRR